MAVVWAKDYLIATLVASIFLTIYTYGTFSPEDSSIIFQDLFRSIVYFSIWFTFLNVSSQVKELFVKRDLNWYRAAAISGGLIVAILLFGFLFNLVTTINPGTPTEVVRGIEENILEETLEGEFAQFYEFAYQYLTSDFYIKWESSGPVDVYFVKNPGDFDKFLAEEDFEVYSGCVNEGKASGEISCTVSTGGFLIYNPNEFEVTYTLIQR